MANYDLFRRKMANSERCTANYEASFILEGASAVEIKVLRLNKIKQAALIITDKEGPDTSLVYTFYEHVSANELLKADYFTWKDNLYFVYEDIDLTRELNYKKQRAYQCNVRFHHGNDCYGGYFVSSLAKYVDTTLQEDLVIDGNEKPVLVMPYCDWLAIGVQLQFGGKTWRIIDFDLITNDKIAYLSLDRDFDVTYENVIEEPKTEEELANELAAGVELEMDIQYGYFRTDANVEVVSKTADKVVFVIPFGIEEITITTKDVDKNDIVKTYKVVVA